MLNHAGFQGTALPVRREVLHSAGTLRMELLGGLQKRMPLTGCLFALGAFSIACLPPFSGFTGEFAIFCRPGQRRVGPGGWSSSLGFALAWPVGFGKRPCLRALASSAYGMVFLGRPRTGFARPMPMRLVLPPSGPC